MASVQEMVDKARQRVAVVTREQLEAELTGGALVVDIRDPRERWRDGTIAGAKSVPRGMLEFWADPDSEYHKPFFDRKRRTILYCAGGMRSALAALTLMEMGFEDVAHLEIGFDGWKRSGGAIADVSVPKDLKPNR